MRRLAAVLAIALVASGCARSSPVRIAAIDPATGATKWVQSTRVGFLDSPRLRSTADAVIVVDASGLTALDPDTGKRRWSMKGDITIADGLALVVDDDEIVARDLNDGREAWRRASPLTGDDVAIAAVADDIVIVQAYEAGRVVAMSVSSGRRLWSRETSKSVGAIGSEVIASDVAGIDVLDARTGSRRWSSAVSLAARLGSMFGPSPLIDAGELIGVPIDRDRSLSNQARLQFRDLSNGNVRWEVDVSLRPLADASDDIVVVHTTNFDVEARNVGDGTLLWSKPLSGVEGLAAVDRVVMVLRTRGRLAAYDAADGSLRWERSVTPGQDLQSAGDAVVLVA